MAKVKGTSPAKAKLYKTAWIIADAWDLPDGFKADERVAVSFLRKTWGSCIYECRNASGEMAAISDFELERFVL